MNETQKEQLKKEFLKQYPCINRYCDGNGAIPVQVGDGEWEAEQCQYCDEIRFKQFDWWLERMEEALDMQRKNIREDIVELAEPYDNAKWHNNLSVKQVLSLPSLINPNNK